MSTVTLLLWSFCSTIASLSVAPGQSRSHHHPSGCLFSVFPSFPGDYIFPESHLYFSSAAHRSHRRLIRETMERTLRCLQTLLRCSPGSDPAAQEYCSSRRDWTRRPPTTHPRLPPPLLAVALVILLARKRFLCPSPSASTMRPSCSPCTQLRACLTRFHL